MRVSKKLDDVYVIDDFLPDPDKVREDGLHAAYVDWEGPDGQVYKRVSFAPRPEVIAQLEGIFGGIELLGMAYRLNYDGEPPNQSIHSDMGWGTHALVLYLSDGPSGTAFWTHSRTDANRILPGDDKLYQEIKNDFENELAWDQRAFIKMKYNRALIYSSELFHSRYPFVAFGDTPETGRLVLVAFFTPIIGAQDESQAG